MITTLIFSKDRACQLELLLRSIHKNFSHISSQINVLYTYTSSDFKSGYNKLQSEYTDINWVEQNNFKNDTLTILKDSCQKHVCFFVDDNIVYDAPNTYGNQVSYILENVEEAGCFSFRLGKNTTIQDPYINKKVDPMPIFYSFGLFLVWDWTAQPYNNFGYPFSVDGHVYNTKLILDTIETYSFETPNALEGRFPAFRIPRAMFCMPKSSVVNNPLNLVGSSENKAGIFYPHSLEELNQLFLNGKRIDLDSLCKNDIVGCHQEMEIKFETS